MELVESYLVEVSQYVPAAQRKDIVGELRTALEEQVADHANAQGRSSPDREDELAVLKGFGHPAKVACEYRDQRYLIGPELFPHYLQALRVVGVIAFVGLLFAGFMAAYLTEWRVSPWNVAVSILEVFLWVVAIVTVVFAVLEYSGEKLKWYERWNPASLARGAKCVADRSDVISNFVSEGVFLLWWNDVLVFINRAPGSGDFPVRLADVWDTLFWPLNVLFAALFVLHAVVLGKGTWSRFGLLSEIALCLALLLCGAVLLSAPELVNTIDGLATIQWPLETIIKAAIVVIMGFTLWDIWLAFRNLSRPQA